MKIKYSIKSMEFAGDLHTPISLYLKLRDIYVKSALLESSDYHSAENSRSIIALCPIASVAINGGVVTTVLPDGDISKRNIGDGYKIHDAIGDFIDCFDIDGQYGVYGYTAYDAIKYLEAIDVNPHSPKDNDAPDVNYILFRYTIVFDHFHNTLTVKEILSEGETSGMDRIVASIESRNYATYDFNREGDVSSPITDEDYREMVRRGKEHCQRGDVFQIVLSRRFTQRFSGDDFALYRKLRSINPSPYLFYFDFGGIRIFGSSPETHCKIEDGVATIDPIAGTAFRTGDPVEDQVRAEALLADPKESSEHVMLVDLARNDLSRNCRDVHLQFSRQIQYYSHVIHIVSRVSGRIKEGISPLKTFYDTFPAGTLSGAPKVRAMELINHYEAHNRGIYGGAIGYIGFDGSINQAITIRTFVSRNGQIEFQAGAGVVIASDPERELQETNNKLGALSRALQQ